MNSKTNISNFLRYIKINPNNKSVKINNVKILNNLYLEGYLSCKNLNYFSDYMRIETSYDEPEIKMIELNLTIDGSKQIKYNNKKINKASNILIENFSNINDIVLTINGINENNNLIYNNLYFRLICRDSNLNTNLNECTN